MALCSVPSASGHSARLSSVAGAVLCLIVLSRAASAAPIVPPDTSLRTFPVAYYGAQWQRSTANIEVLSKMQIVILMQEDGPCWKTCCPDAGDGGQCGPLHNATSIPGCGPQCDQHGKQNEVFARVKAAAMAAGRRTPHCMLYLNAVYDFPFSATHAQGDAIDLLDVHGKPHMENCDPGIYPSFFFDFGRAAAQKAWLAILRRTVAEGSADGVYVDCFNTIPIKCNETTGKCVARRNGKKISVNEEVTPAQLAAYTKGKTSTMRAGVEIVGSNGTFYSKGLNPAHVPPPGSGNIVFFGREGDPPETLISKVASALKGYRYVIVGPANDFSAPTRKETGASTCKETLIATFLLAMEPGCFLLCNGWDADFGRPLGAPTGPAVLKNGQWAREFTGGTRVSFANGTGTVTWTAADPIV